MVTVRCVASVCLCVLCVSHTLSRDMSHACYAAAQH